MWYANFPIFALASRIVGEVVSNLRALAVENTPFEEVGERHLSLTEVEVQEALESRAIIVAHPQEYPQNTCCIVKQV